jgi:uncharacterized delta-60 repeat protein
VRFTDLSAARRAGAAVACLAGALGLFVASVQAAPGDLDPSFSRNGLVTTEIGDYSEANAVAIQPDSKIVVAGVSDEKLALARYTPNGRLDPAFSRNGLVRLRFGNYSEARALAIQPDGKILVLGWSSLGPVMARLTPGGTFDRSFSGDGRLLTDFGGNDDFASDVALDGDGRIIVSGTRSGPPAKAALARFQPNGARDPSFSGDGVATASFAGYGYGDGVAVEPDGSPVLGGQSSSDQLETDLALARFTPDGDPDTSFSGDGAATLDIGPVDDTRGIALRSDGRIVAGGADCSSDLYGSCVGETAQFKPDGSVDDSFGEHGVRTLSLRRGSYYGSAADAPALTPDGGTVLAGTTLQDRLQEGPVDFALVRLDATGSPDPSFRGRGMWTTDFLSGDDSAYDVALQQDGKIVAVGQSDGQVALARYEVKSGPPDADADGVRDRADRCPVRFGDHRDGCTRYRRSLTMKFDRADDLYLGVLASREPRCVSHEKVRVFRARPGRDFWVDTTYTDYDGSWQVDARLHPGHYYAIAPAGFDRAFGGCERARAHGFSI